MGLADGCVAEAERIFEKRPDVLAAFVLALANIWLGAEPLLHGMPPWLIDTG